MDFSCIIDFLADPQMAYFSLFLIIGLGYLIGKISIKGISLDVSAIIFVAMLFGNFGVKLPAIIQNIGLVLFIFTIGIQAGPGFFNSMKKHGIKLALLAVVMAVVSGIIAVSAAYIYGFDMSTMAGVLAGAMTSTPGLATATENFEASAASIGYGIAYPFGVLGVIFFLRLLPKILRVSIPKEEKKWEDETHAEYPEINYIHVEVTNANMDGIELGKLGIRRMTGAVVSRVKHDEEAFTPGSHSVIYCGDLLRLVGTDEALAAAKVLIGTPTTEEIPLGHNYDVRTVLVTNRKIVNKTLLSLNMQGSYDATITRIRRSGIDITPSPNIRIQYADKLVVACDINNMKAVEKLLGNEITQLNKTDFLPMALGIVLGVLLGKYTPLGLTGGVLFAALILGRIGKTGPILWTMSGSSNIIVRELGLILFLAVVGTEAGGTIVDKFQEFGISLFLIGAVITTVPMIIGVVIGMKVLKINFITLLGAISGGMTSTPALAAITPMSRTNAPQIGYATIYPIAMVVIVVIIRLMTLFVV